VRESTWAEVHDAGPVQWPNLANIRLKTRQSVKKMNETKYRKNTSVRTLHDRWTCEAETERDKGKEGRTKRKSNKMRLPKRSKQSKQTRRKVQCNTR
jgi:hypothetical protein